MTVLYLDVLIFVFVTTFSEQSVCHTPRAAVLKGPIDQLDGVFRLDVTHQKDLRLALQNPKIDGYPD
jgi:hypothetical protein